MVDGKIEALDTPAALKKSFGADSLYDVFSVLPAGQAHLGWAVSVLFFVLMIII